MVFCYKVGKKNAFSGERGGQDNAVANYEKAIYHHATYLNKTYIFFQVKRHVVMSVMCLVFRVGIIFPKKRSYASFF